MMDDWRIPPIPLLLAMLHLASPGCQSDERLVEMATRSVETQRAQNQMMHESNKALVETTREVTQQGRELAVAAEKLVEQDARARQDLILAHREMRGELHAERVGVDQQRAELEGERRAIASQRVTEPIIAEAIQAAALWIAALLPVCLAGYVLYSTNRGSTDQAAVQELLVLDITSDQPKLLPGEPWRPMLPREAEAGRAALPSPGDDPS